MVHSLNPSQNQEGADDRPKELGDRLAEEAGDKRGYVSPSLYPGWVVGGGPNNPSQQQERRYFPRGAMLKGGASPDVVTPLVPGKAEYVVEMAVKTNQHGGAEGNGGMFKIQARRAQHSGKLPYHCFVRQIFGEEGDTGMMTFQRGPAEGGVLFRKTVFAGPPHCFSCCWRRLAEDPCFVRWMVTMWAISPR